MRTLHVVVAFLAASLAVATAQAEQSSSPGAKPVERYGRTPAASQFWGMGFSTAGATKVLKKTSASSTPQFFRCGSQVMVSCGDERQGSAHRGGALACWVQTDTATVSLGVAPTTSALTRYTFGDGAGYITDDGNNDGHGACFVVPVGAAVYNMLDCYNFYRRQRATYRVKHCDGSGSDPTDNLWRPCDADADCYDSGSCVATGKPQGAYLALTGTSTTVGCQIQDAR